MGGLMKLKETTFNEVQKLLSKQKTGPNIEKSKKLMEILSNIVAESKEDLTCMNPLLIVNEDTVIGYMGAKDNINNLKQAEIYYEILTEYQRKGYMTRALKLYIEFLKRNYSDVKCVRVFIEDYNIASMMVCKKNHFLKVGESDNNMVEWFYKIE